LTFEKLMTYCLNLEHKGEILKIKKGKEVRKSDGSGKAKLFTQVTDFTNDNANSLNDLYYWLAEEVLNYETSLFEVCYMSYGI